MNGRATAFLLPLLWLCLSTVASDASSIFEAKKGIGIVPLASTKLQPTPAGSDTVFVPNWQQCNPTTINSLRSSGIDLVRLVFSPLPLMTDSAALRERSADLIIQCGEQLLAGGLAVVYDPHFWSPDFEVNSIAAVADPALRERYQAALVSLAARLARQPRDSVALELLNEPPRQLAEQGIDWLSVQLQLISTIRAASKDLLLVATGAVGLQDELTRISDPRYFSDDRLLFTFHFYEPFIFTHQFVWNGMRVNGLEYPAQNDEAGDTLRASLARIEQAQAPAAKKRQVANDVRKYLGSGYGVAQIDRRFEEVGAWARSHGIASNRIFVGEFAALIGFGMGDGSPEVRRSELRWVTDVRRAIERQGFVPSYWNLPRPGAYAFDPSSAYLKPEYLEALGLKPPRAAP